MQNISSVKNICYVTILGQQDEPVFKKNWDRGTDTQELDLIAFTTMDHMENTPLNAESSGGLMSTNLLDEDFYYTYGWWYGTRYDFQKK